MLKPGNSKEIIQENIDSMTREGRKPKEAIALALAEARKSTSDVIKSDSSVDAVAGALGPDSTTPVPESLSESQNQAILERKNRRMFK